MKSLYGKDGIDEAGWERAMNPTPKPMSRAQKIVLRELNDQRFFPGYSELMASTGCTSVKAVDWVLDALKRRGYIAPNDDAAYGVTDAGRDALAKEDFDVRR